MDLQSKLFVFWIRLLKLLKNSVSLKFNNGMPFLNIRLPEFENNTGSFKDVGKKNFSHPNFFSYSFNFNTFMYSLLIFLFFIEIILIQFFLYF